MGTLKTNLLTKDRRRRKPAPRSPEIASGENRAMNQSRWYDSTVGRWLGQDPIGFAGGDANLYRYVGNGPQNASDPTGTQPAAARNPAASANTKKSPLNLWPMANEKLGTFNLVEHNYDGDRYRGRVKDHLSCF